MSSGWCWRSGVNGEPGWRRCVRRRHGRTVSRANGARLRAGTGCGWWRHVGAERACRGPKRFGRGGCSVVKTFVTHVTRLASTGWPQQLQPLIRLCLSRGSRSTPCGRPGGNVGRAPDRLGRGCHNVGWCRTMIPRFEVSPGASMRTTKRGERAAPGSPLSSSRARSRASARPRLPGGSSPGTSDSIAFQPGTLRLHHRGAAVAARARRHLQ
jgi:hypothetical protein